MWTLEAPREPIGSLRAGQVCRARFTPFARGLVTSVSSRAAKPKVANAHDTLLWNVHDMTSEPNPDPVAGFPGRTVFDWWLDYANQQQGHHRLVTWDNVLSKLVLSTIDPEVARGMQIDGPATTSPVDTGNAGLKDALNGQSAASTDTAAATGSIGLGSGLSGRPTVNSLSQELRELRKRTFQGIAFTRIDEAARTCEMTVTAGLRGSHKPTRRQQSSDCLSMDLRITFPSLYPNHAPPSFHFGAGQKKPQTMLQNRVKERMSELASTHVENNEGCLHACLSLLVKMLEDELASDERLGAGNQPDGVDATEPNLLDAHLRLVASCGASFSGNGRLVTFANSPSKIAALQMRLRALSDANSTRAAKFSEAKTTSRSISRFFFGRTTTPQPTKTAPSAAGTANEQLAELRSSRVGSLTTIDAAGVMAARKASNTVATAVAGNPCIFVYDVTRLALLHRELGARKGTHSPQEECVAITKVAQSIGRDDLVRTWTVASQAIDIRLLSSPASLALAMQHPAKMHQSVAWSSHPFGGVLLKTLINHYCTLRDIQTVSMLARVLVTHMQLHGGLKPAAAHALDTGLLHRDEIGRYISCLEVYADVLFRFRFLEASADMRKVSAQLNTCIQPHKPPAPVGQSTRDRSAASLTTLSPQEHSLSLVIGSTCERCGEFFEGGNDGRCTRCANTVLLTCTICRARVRSQFVFCTLCGHGGHIGCMQEWGRISRQCPSGCGCRCSES